MEAFILVVRLYAGGPVVAFPAKDCSEAVAWIKDARSWAIRSGSDPVGGPLYACFPASSPYVTRTRRDE